MAMPPFVFGRTQSAFATPFESQPERANGYVSKTVQEAIEETLALAVANDRLVILPSYNGNANAGRYLEIFRGIDMSIAPFDINTTAKCLFISARTTAANATCTIGFYDITTMTLLYTLTMTAQKQVVDQGTGAIPLFTLPNTGELGIKIDSGSINRPHLIVALSSSI